MLPSSTVENYLKAIFLGEGQLPGDQRLLPMGQLANALGVAPGTATTMIKALAESGLVEYEPYNGVRLSPAGSRLAALVLRRHRLVELFLVNVLGMRWDEVHEEAELLEHVVSDRLIERIDELLGHPEVDPHGDPIPSREGELVHHSDRGSQYVSIRYSERLAEAGIEPSVGSTGDSYDNALAETINGLYKAEIIHRSGPWKTREAVELATLEWVAWFNHHRLLEPIGYIPPAEAEANYWRQQQNSNTNEPAATAAPQEG